MSLADLPGVSEVLIHVAIVVCLGDALGRGCCSGPAGFVLDVFPILSFLSLPVTSADHFYRLIFLMLGMVLCERRLGQLRPLHQSG